MALIKCRECGNKVSSKAVSCPQCGASIKRKGIGCGTLVSFFMLLIIIAWAVTSVMSAVEGNKPSALSSQQQEKITPVKPSVVTDKEEAGSYASLVCDAYQSADDKKDCMAELEAEKNKAEAERKEKASLGEWEYRLVEDEMSDLVTQLAMLPSNNTVSFDFPYNGLQHGVLTIRSGAAGNAVVFAIERGQLLCDNYEGCRVQVRFGESKPVYLKASESSDHKTNLLFIEDWQYFVSNMIAVDEVKLGVDVYQEGRNVFQFNVKGFDKKQFLRLSN